MADKWSYSMPPSIDTKTAFSKMVETSPTASQRMATFLENHPHTHDADTDTKKPEQIETELDKDDQIARLKAENERLKLRNSALRKTLKFRLQKPVILHV